MRTPLLLLFLLSFLLQGLMPARANENHCPMHGVMMQEGVVMQEMDCCNDPQTFAETGQLCKTDVACVVAAISLSSQIANTEIIYLGDRVSPIVPLSNSSQQLATIWRPPALI